MGALSQFIDRETFSCHEMNDFALDTHFIHFLCAVLCCIPDQTPIEEKLFLYALDGNLYLFLSLITAHVWSVEVQRRGLAQDKGLIGRYHLCLTDKSITLNRYGPATSNGESRVDSVEFPMSTVRKGGHLNSVFYMELGRQNVLGAGELWVEAQDAQTAQNIHHSIIK